MWRAEYSGQIALVRHIQNAKNLSLPIRKLSISLSLKARFYLAKR
jgi:hypothetical protein